MAWLALLFSAVSEAVWATSLGYSEGLSRPLPTIVFLLALVASSIGLGWAVKFIPIGTAYAIWTGLGAAMTVGWGIATGAEHASPAKLVCLAGIILAVVGLRLIASPRSDDTEPSRDVIAPAAPD